VSVSHASATDRGQSTPYRVAARRLLRDSLFDAARELLSDRPWAQITMAEVARQAGVSRQTLYMQFGSRDEFAQAFVIREGDRFLDLVEEVIRAHTDDPRAAVAAGLAVFLDAAGRDPLVQLLLDDDGTGGMLPLITTQGRPVLVWASERLCAVMRSGWPQIGDEDAKLLADSVVRLAISYIALPTNPPSAATDEVMRLLDPYISQMLTRRGN
jgi:AcrR family transcriptional regulator